MPIWIASIIALAGLAMAAPAHADWLLLQRVTDAAGQVRAAYTWVGASQLRYDDGRFTLMADLAEDTVHVLDHRRRTVQTLPLPAATSAAAADVQRLAPDRVRGWPTTRYRWSMASGDVQMIAWATQAEAAVASAWRAAQRRLRALPGAGDALPDTASMPGLVVRTRARRASDGAALGGRETLVILERDPYPATYRVPAGYQRITPRPGR